MITTEEAKKIAENIEEAADALNTKISSAAKRGINVKLTGERNNNCDYPYHHISILYAVVDLDWATPEELAELAKEFG